jgi:NADP-dependent 3-hydroxy acid dehydrogenase YdfG
MELPRQKGNTHHESMTGQDAAPFHAVIGASSGIGAALCRRLAAKGSCLIAAGLKTAPLSSCTGA